MFKKKGVPIPEESRFDRMSVDDLYVVMESSLGTAIFNVDRYRAVPSERQQILALLQIQLEDSLAATKALRRKYEVL